MVQNFEAIQNLMVLGHSPKVLFYVTRYWPAITGASLHTRKLIQCLSNDYALGVIRHTGDEPIEKEVAFARNPSISLTDGVTPIYQIGAAPPLRWILEPLASKYKTARWTRPFFHLLLQLSIWRQVEQLIQSYDMIHAVYTGMTSSVRLAQRIAKWQGKPFVLTPLLHLSDPCEKAPRSLRQLYVNSDALIAMTAFEKEWLVRQGVERDRIYVCPYGPLVSRMASPKNFRQQYNLYDYPIVLFVARQIPEKGYHALTLAAQHVWKKHSTTRFIFIGPKNEEADNFFNEFQDPRILNLGEVSDENKSSALAACDIFCLPSQKESLGVAYLEAWEFEKPVIAANIPVMSSIVDHGKNGLIVEPLPSAIASGINQLLDCPTLRHELGCHGYRKVRSQYDWPKVSANVSHIYTKLRQLNRQFISRG